MQRSTNLDLQPPWELLISNAIPRAADGTNIWWDTNPPPTDVDVYYRPIVIWTNLP